MKTKIIHGKEVLYTESAHEMRSILSPEYRHQLLTNTSSTIAICTSEIWDGNMAKFCNELNRSGNFRFSYDLRRDFIRKSNFRILISHRTDNDLFSLVSGTKKHFESFEDTAIRKLGKESELKQDDVLFLGLISGGEEMVSIYPDGSATENVEALYMAMIPSETITYSDSETHEFVWMTPDEINAALQLKRWRPTQVKTVHKLLVSLLQLPEIFTLKSETPYRW